MRHYAARQRQSDMMWHYTCTHRDRTYPIGYCSPHKACDKCHLGYMIDGRMCETCEGTALIRKAQPCEGHPTAEEACSHYKHYLVEKTTFHPDEPGADKGRGAGCDAPGCKADEAGYAQVPGGQRYRFCADHLNTEGLKQVIKVGESWES